MSDEIQLNDDGSMVGRTFSGDNYKGEFPRIKSGDRYIDFHNRVNEAKANGFHLGDLGWSEWHIYNIGYGYQEISEYDYI